MIKKTKKPKFHRQNSQVKKRQGTRWRKPRGIDSKQRKGDKSRGAKPTIGYRQPKKIRGKHPSGYEEILIKNINQLNKVNKETQAVRISATVGAKKKQEIIKKANELKIKVLNPRINKKKKIIKKKKKETSKEKKEEAKKTTSKKQETKESKETKKEEKKKETKEQKQGKDTKKEKN